MINLNDFEAALFDLDGTTITGSQPEKNSVKSLIYKPLKTFAVANFKSTSIKNIQMRLTKSSFSKKEFVNGSDVFFLDLNKYLSPNYKTAIVTNTPTHLMEHYKGKFNFDNFFQEIITGDMVKNQKPEPDCYKLALEKLSADPRYTIGFEDSPEGLTALKSAGIATRVHVKNPVFQKQHKDMDTIATHTINDFSEIKL